MRYFVATACLFASLAGNTAVAQGKDAGTAPTPQNPSNLRILTPAADAKLSQNYVTVTLELNSSASADGSPTFELRLDTEDPIRTTSTEHTFSGLTPGQHVVRAQLIDANDRAIPGATAEARFTVLPPRRSNTPGMAPESEQQEDADTVPGFAPAVFHPGRQQLAAAVTVSSDGVDAGLDVATEELDAAAGDQSQASAPEDAGLVVKEAAGPQEPGSTEPVRAVEPPAVAGPPAPGQLPQASSRLPLLSLIGFGSLVGGLIATMRTRHINRGGA